MIGDAAVQIQQRLDRGVSLIVAGDVRAAVEMLFAPDAIYVMPGATLHGRAAIEEMFLSSPRRYIGGWIRSDRVVVHGDLAYEWGTNSFTIESRGETVVANGRYLTVWQKQADGTWIIKADAPFADPST